VGLTCVLAWAARRRYELSLTRSLAAGLIGATAHFVSLLFHHLGHAVAARSVGRPMTGVRLWAGLGTSVYPDDEPELPASVHLIRASGGPLASLLLALTAAACLPRHGLSGALRQFVLFDNLFVLALGSLLPLPFADGGTFVKWIRASSGIPEGRPSPRR
jgi:Zn-dependent protease